MPSSRPPQTHRGVNVLSFPISWYLRGVRATSSASRRNHQALERFQRMQTPCICVTWHGPSLMFFNFWGGGLLGRSAARASYFHILSSRHRDGEFMARLMVRFGIRPVRGSTDTPGGKQRGGAGAFRTMLRILKSGGSVCLTPDPPPLPPQRMTRGAIALAQLSGAPIIALGLATGRALGLNTRDGFIIPLPFARMGMACSDPVHVPRHASEAELRHMQDRLEAVLQEAFARAQALLPDAPTPPEQA